MDGSPLVDPDAGRNPVAVALSKLGASRVAELEPKNSKPLNAKPSQEKQPRRDGVNYHLPRSSFGLSGFSEPHRPAQGLEYYRNFYDCA